MLSKYKNKNILLSIQDRERSIVPSYRSTLSIIKQLVQSKLSTFLNVWNNSSQSPIRYDGGHFFLFYYIVCYTLYGINSKPSIAYSLKDRMRKNIDALAYTTPVLRINSQYNYDCAANKQTLSRYLLCITKDSWLFQYNWETGLLMSEVYVKPHKSKISFLHCDWNVYSEQIILTSNLNPKGTNNHRNNVVATLAIFSVSPLEFYAMFDVKRHVFGKSCMHVNVSDQMLILGMGNQGVHVYNFTEVIKKGTFQPYKIGDKYELNGKIGFFPTGLPFNLSVDSTPPLLFNIQTYNQTIDFGGFPFHYIYQKKKDDLTYIVKPLSINAKVNTGCILSNILLSDNGNAVLFHPDGSNRIIEKTTHNVRIYEIIKKCEETGLKLLFTMGIPETSDEPSITYSSYGRVTKKITYREYEKYVLAIDYEDELELFGILFISPENPPSGFIKLYSNSTGKEVKYIAVDKKLDESNCYELHIDLDSIIVIERDCMNNFSVFLFQLHFEM